MEKLLLEKLDLHLDPSSTSTSASRLRSLSTARSLLTNPDSSDSTRLDAVFLRHAVKVLGDAALLHRPLAAAVINAVHPFLDGGDRLAAAALAVIASIGDFEAVDEGLVLSLAASSFGAIRLQLIEFLVRSVTVLRPRVMVRVLLGLAVDPHPAVRRAAVDGLVVIWRRDGGLVESSSVGCCYGCGVVLLKDEDELVRVATVRLLRQTFKNDWVLVLSFLYLLIFSQVSACGEVFAAIKEETDEGMRMDVVFL